MDKHPILSAKNHFKNIFEILSWGDLLNTVLNVVFTLKSFEKVSWNFVWASLHHQISSLCFSMILIQERDLRLDLDMTDRTRYLLETLKIQISITMSDLTDMGIKCATSLFYNVTKYAKIFADLMVIVSRRSSIKYIEATH